MTKVKRTRSWAVADKPVRRGGCIKS